MYLLEQPKHSGYMTPSEIVRIHTIVAITLGNLKRSHPFGCLWRVVRKVIAREFKQVNITHFGQEGKLKQVVICRKLNDIVINFS